MVKYIRKAYEALKNFSEGLFSPEYMAEFYFRQYNGMREIIKLCIKHYLYLLLPMFSMLAGICWLAWKTFLLLARVEEWPSSLFQNKKGMSWE